MPTTTLASLRQDIARKIYAGHFPVVGATTADSDSRTLLTDSALAPAAQSEDYVGAWLFVAEQPDAVDSTANIDEGAQFSASDTTLTVTDGTLFTAGDGIQFGAGATPDAEICRVTTVAVNDLTIVRGIQGTTATTHENADNVFIVGPAVGEISRVTNVSFSGSNSNLTIAPALSASLISGTNYELHYKFHPNDIRTRLNEVLENVRRPIWLPLTLIADGDMETSGVANWTATNSTRLKVTVNVLFGRQSLQLTATDANGLVSSGAIAVAPGTDLLVAALVDITSGDSAKLTLQGSATSTGTYADIDTAESAASGWVLFAFEASTTSTQEWVRVQLESQANTDITTWNFVTVLRRKQGLYPYPGSLEWGEDFDSVWYMPLGDALNASTDDNAYRALEVPFKKWSDAEILRDETAVVPYRIQVLKRPINQILMARGLVDYATLTSDSDTTTMPSDIAIDLTYANLLDAWAQEDIARDRVEAAVAKSAKAIEVRTMLGPRMRQFQEPKGRVRGTKR